MILAGVDLAWQSANNPSAIAVGSLESNVLTVNIIEPAIYGIDSVFELLNDLDGLMGVSIDAPLIINNTSGQRTCETEVGKTYGSRGASCHTANTSLYPDANSVYLSKKLVDSGFSHLEGMKWQIECYPHPSIIEIFRLAKRLKYKKGIVADRRDGQKTLAALLIKLKESDVLRLAIGEKVSGILDESYIDSLKGQALKNNEDALDSVVCLYIAGLYSIGFSGRTFGNVDSGYIWIPQGSCI